MAGPPGGRSLQSPLPRCLAALLAGALAPLSFSPVGFWPAGLLSVLALFALLRQGSARQAALAGWCYGLGFFGVGVSWIYVSIDVYGNAGPLLAGLLTLALVMGLALFFSLQAALFRHFLGRRWPVLGFAALWVAFEWLRGWILTGFPWLYLGYAHLHTPLAGLAPVTGVFGLSFAVSLSAGLLFVLGRGLGGKEGRPLRAWAPALVALALIWGAGALLTQARWVKPREIPPLEVGLVQANIDQLLKFDRDYLEESLALYEALSEPLWDKDIVVWPETAVPLLYQQAGPVLAHFSAQASAGGSSLLTGILYREDGRIHNSIIGLGTGEGVYHKQKLVPFGEYVPLEEQLRGLLEIFELPMSSLRPGPDDQPLLEAAGLKLAPYICYEIVYPDFVARTAREADLLLTVSNDTWFGASWGPLQHLEMAAMRALENGRYLLRATNNGVTAIIDEKGKVLQRAPQFEIAVLEGQARLFDGLTPFTRWGSTPVIVLVFLSLAACLFLNLARPAARHRS